MLDLSYESYLDKKDKGKIKVKKLKNNLSYDAFLGQKTKQQDTLVERTQRIEQGLPVSTNINKSKPNVLGSIVRTPLKLAAEVGTSVVKSAQKLGDVFTGDNSKELEPFSGKYLGNVEGLGKLDMTKSPLDPENLKTIKKSVGVGAELASYLTYGGIAKGALTGTLKNISEEGAKETFKQFIKQKGVSLLKEGALTGAAYTAGSQLQENADTGKDFSWKQALIDISTSTVLTPAAAFGLRKLGDVIPTKKVTPDIPAKVEPTPSQPLDLDPLAQEARKYKSAEEFTKAQTNAYHGGSNIDKGIQLGRSKYAKTFFASDSKEVASGYGGKGAVVNDIHIKPDTKLIDIKNATPEEITAIRNEIKKIQDTYVPYSGEGGFNPTFGNSVDELIDGARRGKSHFAEDPALVDVYKKLGYDGMISYEDIGNRGKNIGVWNKEKVLTKSQLTDIYNKAVGDTTIPKTEPVVKTSKPKQKTIAEETVNKDVETFARDMGENVDDFNEGTFKEWSKGLRNLDIEEVKSVAKGGKKVTPTSIPEGAYLSFMKNIADETGDVKLVQELSNSNVVSKAAQSTVASKLSARGNTTDLLRDIKKSILSRKGTDLDRLTREETKTFNNLKSKIKEITETAPSTKEVKDIISSIFCK